MDYRLYPLGDLALVVEFGRTINLEIHNKIRAFVERLESKPIPGLMDIVPTFTTVTIYYDPLFFSDSPYQEVCKVIAELLKGLRVEAQQGARTVTIPVCYGGEYGPDLEYVAEHNQITKEEVIAIHCSGDYLVYMIGFAPGFPYIGGMPAEIATPRRASPRLLIPAGSVGIAGEQTGVYPIETPGGWQLIGRTPIKLFQANSAEPSFLKAGDKIIFTPISAKEYKAIEEGFQ